MSTTTAPRSEPAPTQADFRGYARKVWRLVEAQHRISTNRLAANADDQALLEQLVEEVKPTLPPAARPATTRWLFILGRRCNSSYWPARLCGLRPDWRQRFRLPVFERHLGGVHARRTAFAPCARDLRVPFGHSAGCPGAGAARGFSRRVSVIKI